MKQNESWTLECTAEPAGGYVEDWKRQNLVMQQAVSPEEEQRSIDLDKVSDFGPGRVLAPPKTVEFTSGI